MKMILVILCVFYCFLSSADAFINQVVEGQALSRFRLHCNHVASGNGYLYPIDFQQSPDSNYQMPKGQEHVLKIIGTPGDLYSGALMLILGQVDLRQGLAFSPLQGKQATISADRIRVLEAICPHLNKTNEVLSWLLLRPDFQNVSKGDMIPLIYSVSIPKNLPPGMYHGMLAVDHLQLPIQLQVLPFQLPELKESFGFFMPGHFYRAVNHGIYSNFAFREWNAQNIQRYVDFCCSRRINSTALYHIYPEFKEDGSIDFSELSSIAQAMRKSGANGKLVICLRHMTWRANARALKDSTGDARPLRYGEGVLPGIKFHPKALEYFETYLRKLLEVAKREQWPQLLIATEEELSNTTAKEKGYRYFLPVLQKVCPQRTLIIDNEIGYGRDNEVDRGHRDAVGHRQYNSWTLEALRDAEVDKAVIGNFNYGFHRMTTGFLQYRLKSQFYHQWADQWYDSYLKKNWHHLFLTSQGVVSSWEIERFHAGRLDLAACHLLEEEIRRLQKSGNEVFAGKLEAILSEVVSDIPVNGNEYRDWTQKITSKELDLRRTKLFHGVWAARHGSFLKQAIAGQPKLLKITRVPMVARREQGLLQARCSENMNLDAFHGEPGYVCTGPIRYVVSQENKIKSQCSSGEEFATKHTPSYSAGYVTYDQHGLWLAADGNHLFPGGQYRFSRMSDDSDLWKDDSFQFFWYIPVQKSFWQLIINTKGERTLMRNWKNVKDSSVKTIARSPINSSIGTAVEAFVPWKVLGLQDMPTSGTIWGFNYAREFHTCKQNTSWGRVYKQFAERKHWGQLYFTGKTDTNYLLALDVPVFCKGGNRLSGRITPNIKRPLTVSLELPGKVSLVSTKVQPGGRFTLSCTVNNESRIFLMVRDGIKTLDFLTIPVKAEGESAEIVSYDKDVISGEKLSLCVQTGYMPKEPQELEVIFSNEKRSMTLYPCTSITMGKWQLILDTSGMEPGKWNVTVGIRGKKASVPKKIQVLPDFCILWL